MASSGISDIETRLFRYFVALAEEQHFARAALRLGITPPTLTHQIQKLESRLRAKLLERKGNRRVALTEAGTQFFAQAQHVLHEIEKAALIARQAERGEAGRIELGFMTGVSFAGLLQGWIGAFKRANPAIDITIRKLAPVTQIAAMMRKELDAGFTRAPHKYPAGLQGIEVYRESMVLAVPAEHPLARRKSISPAMLRNETFVNTTAELDVAFFGHTEAVAGIGNFTPQISKRDNDFSTLLTYVALGDGIAVIPQIMRRISVPNVVFRDIAGSPVPQTSLAFVYRDDASPSANLLIKHMRHHALAHARGAAMHRRPVAS